MVRLTENGTEVRWLPPDFSAQVPHLPALDTAVASSNGLLTYDRAGQTLTVHGKLDEPTCRRLLTCYSTHADRAVIHGVLRGLQNNSLLHMPDDELRALETFARRIRGEIFFATRWVIVEGQAEYLLMHALARQLGYDLDEHGVSVIDAVNNGHPATFAALARALGIPWIAVLDGDDAGRGYLQAIINRDFEPTFVNDRCKMHARGNLEQQLLADGLEAELRAVLETIGQADAPTIDRPTLERRLEGHKTACAAELAARITRDAALAQRMPSLFRDAIASLRGLV